ncbi:MAG TPA: hypothetical protein VFJ43_12900, partial [Bacteroidia bacterium]|nr:hypothetical protein [Bacteroidia bacterium]
MSGIIQCPQCGAASSTKLSATEYHCTYCESNFTVGMSKEEMIASILAKSGIGAQRQPSTSTKITPEMIAEMRAKAVTVSASAKKTGLIVLVSILLFVGGIVGFVLFTVNKAVGGITTTANGLVENASITKFKVFNGSKGPALWLLQEQSKSMNDSTHYVLQIFNPESKKQLTQIEFIPAMTWDDAFNSSKYIGEFYPFGDTCWIVSEQYGLTARDAYTGKILVGPNQLSKMYPELQKGISKAEWGYSDRYFSIMTNDGFEYLFFPDRKKVVKKDDWNNRSDDKNKITKTFFQLTDDKRPQLFISKEKTSPDDNSSSVYSSDLENFKPGKRPENMNEDVLSLTQPLPDLIFFNGFIEYADNDKMIVAYQNSIAKKSALHISCIDSDGKVV